MSLTSYIPTIAKAIAGAAAAFGAAFTLAMSEGINTGEWVTIVVATVVAFSAVWYTPNKAA